MIAEDSNEIEVKEIKSKHRSITCCSQGIMSQLIMQRIPESLAVCRVANSGDKIETKIKDKKKKSKFIEILDWILGCQIKKKSFPFFLFFFFFWGNNILWL